MPLKEPGANAPLAAEACEALWRGWAVYLERSRADLAEAWRLSEDRVRALPRFSAGSVDVAAHVAWAAADEADPGLLTLAEELRARVRGERDVSSIALGCAIEHAKRRCGQPDAREAAVRELADALAVFARGHTLASETLIRCGEEGAARVERGSIVADAALLSYLREAGPERFAALVREKELRLRLDDPLPTDLAPAVWPHLRVELTGVSHQLLHPRARTAAAPGEAARAVEAEAPRVAALLHLAAGDEARARALSKGRGMLSEHPLEVTTQMVHFDGFVRYVMPRRGALEGLVEAPGEKAALRALGAIEADPKAAAKLLKESAREIAKDEALDPHWRRPRALGLVLEIALRVGCVVVASQVANKMAKASRAEHSLRVARVYADAGDVAGAAQVVEKLDAPNRFRFPETSPVALAALRALVAQNVQPA